MFPNLQMKGITNKQQFKRLLEILKENKDIATFSVTNKDIVEDFWRKISIELNALGPPSREPKLWKRVWVDFKCAVKRKMVNKKKSLDSSSDPFNSIHTFNELERMALEISGLTKFQKNENVEDNSNEDFDIKTESTEIISQDGFACNLNSIISKDNEVDYCNSESQIDFATQSVPTKTDEASSFTEPIEERKRRKRKHDSLYSRNLIKFSKELFKELDDDDEIVHITRSWACKLRRLPQEQRIFAEKAINDILFTAELGNLKIDSVKINLSN